MERQVKMTNGKIGIIAECFFNHLNIWNYLETSNIVCK